MTQRQPREKKMNQRLTRSDLLILLGREREGGGVGRRRRKREREGGEGLGC